MNPVKFMKSGISEAALPETAQSLFWANVNKNGERRKQNISYDTES